MKVKLVSTFSFSNGVAKDNGYRIISYHLFGLEYVAFLSGVVSLGTLAFLTTSFELC